MEYIHLVGTEQVQSAANQMRAAADDMQRAVGHLDEVLRQHSTRMNDWLQLFEQVLAERKP